MATLGRDSPSSKAFLNLDTLPSQVLLLLPDLPFLHFNEFQATLELTLVNLGLTLPLVNLATQHLEQATLDIRLSRDSCKPFPSHQVEPSC